MDKGKNREKEKARKDAFQNLIPSLCSSPCSPYNIRQPRFRSWKNIQCTAHPIEAKNRTQNLYDIDSQRRANGKGRGGNGNG